MRYKTIVIYDTEYTAWPNSKAVNWGHPGQHRELVQIAARRWKRGEDWREGETFMAYIRPRLNPKLSPFFKKLTGITQALVDKAQGAEAVMKRFAKFAEGCCCLSNGQDINPVAETAGLQRFVLPIAPTQFGNLRPWIYDVLKKEVGAFDRKSYPSGALYKLLKLKLPTNAVHNAMHDVDSICATLEALEKRGVKISQLWK